MENDFPLSALEFNCNSMEKSGTHRLLSYPVKYFKVIN